MRWHGVFPAITTPFRPDLSVDHAVLARHADWLIANGACGIVTLGVAGEGGSLALEEKRAVLATVAEACAGRVPLVAGIGGRSTAEAVYLAHVAADTGVDGVMVFPPYLSVGDWREIAAHFRAVIATSPLPCMLYNNPLDFGTDITPEQIAELADLSNLEAVKESNRDVSRVSDIRERLGERLAIFVGLDDLLVVGIQTGAIGWIGGLANALPLESVHLFNLAMTGERAEMSTYYEWFLPLLQLDARDNFVQLIKFVQAEIGWGAGKVRPPRLPLASTERHAVRELVRERLACRPTR